MHDICDDNCLFVHQLLSHVLDRLQQCWSKYFIDNLFILDGLACLWQKKRVWRTVTHVSQKNENVDLFSYCTNFTSYVKMLQMSCKALNYNLCCFDLISFLSSSFSQWKKTLYHFARLKRIWNGKVQYSMD